MSNNQGNNCTYLLQTTVYNTSCLFINVFTFYLFLLSKQNLPTGNKYTY